jgi:hypothetical protein
MRWFYVLLSKGGGREQTLIVNKCSELDTTHVLMYRILNILK